MCLSASLVGQAPRKPRSAILEAPATQGAVPPFCRSRCRAKAAVGVNALCAVLTEVVIGC